MTLTDENEGIDQMYSALPPGILNGDSHWAFEGPTCTIYQAVSVRRACKSKEERHAHVNENDAIYDLSNR